MSANALFKSIRRATTWCLVFSLAAAPVLPAFAQVETQWSMDEYQRLSTDMDAADELLLLLAPDSEQWRTASEAALEARRALVAYISNTLRWNTMPDAYIESATQARLMLVQNIIDLTADLGYCDQARSAMLLLRQNADASDTLREAFELSQQAVDSCVSYNPVTEAPPEPVMTQQTSVASQADDPPPDLLQDEPERAGASMRLAGVSLLVTGGAMVAGGLAWDAVSAAGPRSEFTDLSRACDVGLPCYTRLTELAAEIEASRLPIGALTIGGAALAFTGSVLLLAAPRDRNPARVSLTPAWRPGYVGATIGFR
jgi:hypothetical protein